jgi:precorrin-3B synthase
MQTGDGLLVRLRITRGEVTAETFAAIGNLAKDFGNGLVDLSQRGNLQLRGVSVETLPALTVALHDLRLLETEAIRDIILSPLAGLDRTASIDGRALLSALEAKLAASIELNALPDKFCFLIDDGGGFGLDGVAADIRLIGHQGKVILAIASSDRDFIPIAATDPSHAVDAAVALARAFLSLAEKNAARRMKELVRKLGATAITHAAGLTSAVSLPPLRRRVTNMEDLIGIHDGFIGVAGVFGRFDGNQMRALASLASEGLLLTPWRAVLLPNADTKALASLKNAGLIVSPDNPRLAIAACSGQPACSSAQIDTRAVAQTLAPFIKPLSRDSIGIHISGCSKGCAHAAAAPVTVVGREGAYDVVIDGRADADPILRGLDLSQVMGALDAAHAGKLAP